MWLFVAIVPQQQIFSPAGQLNKDLYNTQVGSHPRHGGTPVPPPQQERPDSLGIFLQFELSGSL